MHANTQLPPIVARSWVLATLICWLAAPQPAAAEQFIFEQTFKLEDAPMWGVANDRLEKSYFLGATWGPVEISQQLDVAGLANGVFESSITAGRLGLELGLTSGIAPATTGGAVTANGAINAVVPAKVQFNAPASVSRGERNISISVGWSIGSGFKFTTIGPSLNAKLDFVGSGKVDARFAGQVLGGSSSGSGSQEGTSSGASSTASSYDSGKFTVVDFNNTRVPLIAGSSVTAFEVDAGPFNTVRLEVPAGADVTSNTRVAHNQLKGSSRTSPVLSLNTDVDSIISTAIGLQPTFGFEGGPNVTANPVSATFNSGLFGTDLTLNYIDLSLNAGFRFAQDFTFEVDAFQLNARISDKNGNVIDGWSQTIENPLVDVLFRTFNVPDHVPGNELIVSFDAIPLIQVVNNTGFVASADAILSMFGAKARIGGLVVYDQSLITKLLNLAESDPVYIFGQTLYAGAPRLGSLTESFSIAVVPEPEAWLCMLAGLCLLTARRRRGPSTGTARSEYGTRSGASPQRFRPSNGAAIILLRSA